MGSTINGCIEARNSRQGDGGAPRHAQKVLIAGLGDVGTEAARRLLAGGAEVTGLRRRAAASLHGITHVQGDLSDASSLAPLSRREFTHVVFCAAACEHTAEAYEKTYVEGLRNLLQVVCSPRLERVVFTSSTGVYAQDDGSWVDETSPAEQTHFTGRIMRAAEQTLIDSGLPHVIARLGGIYGPGRTRMIDAVRFGSEKLRMGPPRYLNLIHRDDAAGAVVHLLTMDQPEPLYLCVDDAPTGRNEILLWLAEQLGVPPPAVTTEAEPPSFRGNKRCSNRKLSAAGYELQHRDFRDGYAELIAALAPRS